MGAFQFRALNLEGNECQGILSADSARQIRDQLREKELLPLDVKRIQEEKNLSVKSLFEFSRMRNFDRVIILRQLANLITSSLPLEEALEITAKQVNKTSLKKVLLAIRAKVLEGYNFSSALALFPKQFPTIYSASISAAEESGYLDKVLNELADYAENHQRFQQQVLQALLYPMIMVVACVSIVSFLLAFVIPKMLLVLTENDQAVPTITKLLIFISYFAQHYLIWLFLAFSLLILLNKYLMRKESYSYWLHSLFLKIPLLKHWIKVSSVTRFTRTLGMLTAAGVPIVTAISIAAQLIYPLPIRKGVLEAGQLIQEGMSVHHALKKVEYFDPFIIHLVANGEATGQLDNTLLRIAETQDWHMRLFMQRLLAFFEPTMILMMGGVVLFIVLAVIMPIFNLNQLV